MNWVLVCGGRNYLERDFLFSVLDHYHASNPFSVVIHGAASGADQWAVEWAKARGVPLDPYSVQWGDMKARPLMIRYRQGGERYNAAAGAIRNTKMLDDGKPDVVIAFPGGKGTRDMVRQARVCHVPVLVIPA